MTRDTRSLAGALVASLALLLLLDHSPTLQGWVTAASQPLAAGTAELIRWSGLAVDQQASVLRHPDGFAYRITHVCSGIRAAVVIVLVVLVLPLSGRQRASAIAIGLLGVTVMNFGRLLHLYWIGVAHMELFSLMHRGVWNLIAVSALLAYLGAWIRYAGPRSEPQCPGGRC